MFLGLHPVEPGGEPAEQHDDDDDQNTARAADAAGDQPADPVLALAQQLLEVGRSRALWAAAPGTLAAAALIIRHFPYILR